MCTHVWQVGHADKNGQCALVHAGLRGHAEIVNFLLGQDWGAEIPADRNGNDTVTGKTQAVQQAATAAASMGHTQVRSHSITREFVRKYGSGFG